MCCQTNRPTMWTPADCWPQASRSCLCPMKQRSQPCARRSPSADSFWCPRVPHRWPNRFPPVLLRQRPVKTTSRQTTSRQTSLLQETSLRQTSSRRRCLSRHEMRVSLSGSRFPMAILVRMGVSQASLPQSLRPFPFRLASRRFAGRQSPSPPSLSVPFAGTAAGSPLLLPIHP